ncbi:MAG: succinate dehydrogenase, cytochrome b556 subunit [Acidiferrobacterales bacterium]
MEKNRKRPVYLNLLKIRLPVGGMVSILHRITGVLLAALLPASVYLLQRSFRSEADFEQLSGLASTPVVRLGLLVVLWVFSHHFFAGIRHLLMDLDIGISRASGRAGAWLVFAAGVVPVAYAVARIL